MFKKKNSEDRINIEDWRAFISILDMQISPWTAMSNMQGGGGGFEGLTDIAGGHVTIIEVTLLYHYSVTAALSDFTGDNQPTFDM